MNSEIHVREATINDAGILAEFNGAMARETENKELPPGRTGPGVRALFAKPEYGFYLVAEIENRIAGSLMVTKEWSDWRNGLFWWIQSVYVRPEFRRRGVYRALYEAVRTRAGRHPMVCGCRLYVEKNNAAAQEVYRRLGMYETHYTVFEELFECRPGKTQ